MSRKPKRTAIAKNPVETKHKWAGYETIKEWKEYEKTLLKAAKAYSKQAKKLIEKYVKPPTDKDKTERYKRTRDHLVADHTRIIYAYYKNAISASETTGRTKAADLREGVERKMELYMKTLELVLQRKDVTRQRLALLEKEIVGITKMLADDEKLTKILMENVLTGAKMDKSQLEYIVSKTTPANLPKKDGVVQIDRETMMKGHIQGILGPIFRNIIGDQMREFSIVFLAKKGIKEFMQLVDGLLAAGTLKPRAYKDLLKYLSNNSNIRKIERHNLKNKYSNLDMDALEKQYQVAKKIMEQWAKNLKFGTHINNLQRAITPENFAKAFAGGWSFLTFGFNAFAHRKNLGSLPENPFAIAAVGAGLYSTGALETIAKSKSKEERMNIERENARDFLTQQHEEKITYSNFLWNGGYGAIVEFQNFQKEKRLRSKGITDKQAEELKSKAAGDVLAKQDTGRMHVANLEKFIASKKGPEAASLREKFGDVLAHYNRLTINKMINETYREAQKLYIHDQSEYSNLIMEHNRDKGKAFADAGINQRKPKVIKKTKKSKHRPKDIT